MGVTHDEARTVAERFGTPIYLYDLDAVEERCRQLRTLFGTEVLVSYAVKANPNPLLLEGLTGQVPRLDISSVGELRRGLVAGWEAGVMSFTGPGKTRADLAEALGARVGHIVVESLDEACLLNQIAATAGRKAPILLRIAPASLPKGFGVGMSGRPTQFGVDEEDLPGVLAGLRELSHVCLEGFHAYAGTQCLMADSVADNLRNLGRLFMSTAELASSDCRMLVFGSGFGIPYHEGDGPLDLGPAATAMAEVRAQLAAHPRTRQASVQLELGRWLVGEAGVYLTRVVRVKRSRGTRIAICNGGMNHHLAACGHLGSVIHRNYRMTRVGEGAGLLSPAAEAGPVDLVGSMCTSIDTLGHGAPLGALEAGDVVAVFSSGAYGLTASPTAFISHPPPQEVIVRTSGQQRVYARTPSSLVAPGPGRLLETAQDDRTAGYG